MGTRDRQSKQSQDDWAAVLRSSILPRNWRFEACRVAFALDSGTNFMPIITRAAIAITLAMAPGVSALGQSITFEHGPCLGECPVYRFEATAAESGIFEGRRFTTVLGKHRFSITPGEWSAFQGALAPYRPRGMEDITTGHPRCRRMATDHASVAVTWTDQDRTDRLVFNFGCKGPENAAIARVLSAAPDLLAVGKLIEDRRLEDGAWDRHQPTGR
ncbi:hypothetical protein CN183_13770 [Sinorhizobium medicae]|nr:hypothetical protein CN183_13770 [Sinorhizobium medicae]